MAIAAYSSSVRRAQGFTLVELLVALFVMSLLALMSWRGIDSMARAQEVSRERADHLAAMQTVLAQWQTDLDQMLQTGQTSAIDYDGRLLRITRRYGATELRVIGWARREVDGKSRWLRWQSEALGSRTELTAAWAQAALWGQNPTAEERKREVITADIDDWQIFYFRAGSWTNPQSSADSTGAPGAPAPSGSVALIPPPDGVRLILNLSQGQALAGQLTRDWVRPNTSS
jgi:general secretion pathway protein J